MVMYGIYSNKGWKMIYVTRILSGAWNTLIIHWDTSFWHISATLAPSGGLSGAWNALICRPDAFQLPLVALSVSQFVMVQDTKLGTLMWHKLHLPWDKQCFIKKTTIYEVWKLIKMLGKTISVGGCVNVLVCIVYIHGFKLHNT